MVQYSAVIRLHRILEHLPSGYPDLHRSTHLVVSGMEQACQVYCAGANGVIAADRVRPLLLCDQQLACVPCNGIVAAVRNRYGVPRFVLPVL